MSRTSSMKSWQDAEDATLATASAGDRQQATAVSIAVSGAGMAKKKRRARRSTTTYATDKELIANLKEVAPEVLQSRILVTLFGTTVEGLLKESPSDEIRYFYCRPCGEYHLKTHRHYAEVKQRKTNRAHVHR